MRITPIPVASSLTVGSFAILCYHSRMDLIKIVLVWCTCLIVLAGNVASAATACCCLSGDESEIHWEAADTQATMPCHEKTDTTHSQSDQVAPCDQCGCMHGTQISILPTIEEPVYLFKTDKPPIHQQGQPSNLHELIFQPPKPLS